MHKSFKKIGVTFGHIRFFEKIFLAILGRKKIKRDPKTYSRTDNYSL